MLSYRDDTQRAYHNCAPLSSCFLTKKTHRHRFLFFIQIHRLLAVHAPRTSPRRSLWKLMWRHRWQVFRTNEVIQLPWLVRNHSFRVVPLYYLFALSLLLRLLLLFLDRRELCASFLVLRLHRAQMRVLLERRFVDRETGDRFILSQLVQ